MSLVRTCASQHAEKSCILGKQGDAQISCVTRSGIEVMQLLHDMTKIISEPKHLIYMC